MAPSHQDPRPLREIQEDQVEGVCAAFVLAHEGCTEAVEFGRLADTLVCHCARHDETLTYAVRPSDPTYSLFHGG